MPSLDDAIDWAVAHEIPWARDPAADPANWGIHLQDPPPWNVLRGPVHARGPSSGVVVRRGAELAAWGEPDRADLTFSVAKTYLALLAGVAHGRGLLPDPDEPVGARVRGIGFESAHNAAVTWTMLLQQTSEWEGSVFGLPDTVDRYRTVAHAGQPATGRKGDARPLRAPGTYWEYNDVRINQLSLALMHLFGRPLPEVLDEAILGPLGSTSDWSWVGYDDAWVELPDPARGPDATRRVQSVPGGTHWGGGVSISARDQARVGALLAARGEHAGRALVPAAWIERMLAPCAIAPFYGMLVWLNGPRRRIFPSAGPASVFMIGAGGHLTWVDPDRDLVVVARWVAPEHTDTLVSRVLAGLG
ncbi:MAG: serine hydrolase [Burkholderiales bacterium]|jgi:CubicO group peptidase (beta-lactamase class C family)